MRNPAAGTYPVQYSSGLPRDRDTRRRILTPLAVVGVLAVISIGVRNMILRRQEVVQKQSQVEVIGETDAYQYSVTARSNFDTTCYSTEVPTSANTTMTVGDGCSVRVFMPDTTVPVIQVTAITDREGLTVKEAAAQTKKTYESEYRDAGMNDAEVSITEDVGLAGLQADRIDYTDGNFAFVSYYVEVPADKSYREGGKPIRAFLINGYSNGPHDVLSVYIQDFLSKLRFK